MTVCIPSRSGRGKVRFAVRQTRNAGCGAIQPLCCCGHGCDCENRGHERTASSIHRRLQKVGYLAGYMFRERAFVARKGVRTILGQHNSTVKRGGLTVLRLDRRHLEFELGCGLAVRAVTPEKKYQRRNTSPYHGSHISLISIPQRAW